MTWLAIYRKLERFGKQSYAVEKKLEPVVGAGLQPH
jgi:hypothetical protein